MVPTLPLFNAIKKKVSAEVIRSIEEVGNFLLAGIAENLNNGVGINTQTGSISFSIELPESMWNMNGHTEKFLLDYILKELKMYGWDSTSVSIHFPKNQNDPPPSFYFFQPFGINNETFNPKSL